MKILSDNIWLLFLLVLLGAGNMSCTEDVWEASHAEVTFTATIQDEANVRAFGNGLKVNTLVVGIYDEEQTCIDRKTFPIVASTVDVQLALVKEQNYYFVFWAYNNQCEAYDMTELTAIKMKNEKPYTTFAQAENSDAFFAAVEDFKVTANLVEEVILTRPLVQINVGTSGTAVKASFTVKSAANTFHPFTKTVSGEENFIWTFEGTTDETFSVNETPYTYLAMCYLFAPVEESTQKACELVLTDADRKMEIPSVELRANHRSNIVGNFTE